LINLKPQVSVAKLFAGRMKKACTDGRPFEMPFSVMAAQSRQAIDLPP